MWGCGVEWGGVGCEDGLRGVGEVLAEKWTLNRGQPNVLVSGS